jgi:[ribosomal protein S5]-alanine N-acetyltransferase
MLLKMSDLATERLLLREFRQTDVANVASWEGTLHAETFLEFCLQSYRAWGMGPWAMLLKQNGAIVGNCGFCRIRYDRSLDTLEYCGEVNYYVAPQYRREGLATEALRAVLRFGFGDIRLTRIQGRCPPENVSSERVMQKAGLKFDRMIAGAAEGSLEERLYAIMREDFSATLEPRSGGMLKPGTEVPGM